MAEAEAGINVRLRGAKAQQDASQLEANLGATMRRVSQIAKAQLIPVLQDLGSGFGAVGNVVTTTASAFLAGGPIVGAFAAAASIAKGVMAAYKVESEETAKAQLVFQAGLADLRKEADRARDALAELRREAALSRGGIVTPEAVDVAKARQGVELEEAKIRVIERSLQLNAFHRTGVEKTNTILEQEDGFKTSLAETEIRLTTARLLLVTATEKLAAANAKEFKAAQESNAIEEAQKGVERDERQARINIAILVAKRSHVQIRQNIEKEDQEWKAGLYAHDIALEDLRAERIKAAGAQRTKQLAHDTRAQQAIASAFSSALSSTISGGVEAFARGEETVLQAGGRLLGGIAAQVGQTMIALGTASLITDPIKLAFPALNLFLGPVGSGLLLIGAGAGLVALGAGLGAIASGAASAGAAIGGGGAPPAFGSRAGPGLASSGGFGQGEGSGTTTIYNVTYSAYALVDTMAAAGRKVRTAIRAAERLGPPVRDLMPAH